MHWDPSVRTRLDPADVLQEAYLAIAERLSDFLKRRPMPFHLWARRTAHELLLNAWRHHHAARRNVRRETSATDSSFARWSRPFLSVGRDPSEIAQANELRARLARVLAELRTSIARSCSCGHIQEMPYHEIAVHMDVSASAARQRHARAIGRMQKRLSTLALCRRIRALNGLA